MDSRVLFLQFFDNQTNNHSGKIWGVLWRMSTKFSSCLPQSKTFVNIGYISFPEDSAVICVLFCAWRHSNFVSSFIFMGKYLCVCFAHYRSFLYLNEHMTGMNHLFKCAQQRKCVWVTKYGPVSQQPRASHDWWTGGSWPCFLIHTVMLQTTQPGMDQDP